VDIIDVNLKNIADSRRQSSRNCIVLYPLFSMGSNYFLISFFLFAAVVTWLDFKNQDGSSLMRSPSERFGFGKFYGIVYLAA
jgi:hypothetical protein